MHVSNAKYLVCFILICKSIQDAVGESTDVNFSSDQRVDEEAKVRPVLRNLKARCTGTSECLENEFCQLGKSGKGSCKKKIALGGKCKAHGQCISGLCGDYMQERNLRNKCLCQADNECPSKKPICYTGKCVKDTCLVDPAKCDSGEFCDAKGKCKAKLVYGRRCKSPGQCLSGACGGGKKCLCLVDMECSSKKPICKEGECVKENCLVEPLRCSSTEFCDSKGQCRHKLFYNKKCSASVQCLSGACGNNGKCLCQTDKECTSKTPICHEGVCVKESCLVKPSKCADTSFCDTNGVCQTKRLYDKGCTSSAQCVSGSCIGSNGNKKCGCTSSVHCPANVPLCMKTSSKCAKLSSTVDTSKPLIHRGKHIKSPSGSYTLMLQNDCELVFYKDDRILLWRSSKKSKKPVKCSLFLDRRGAVVVRTHDNLDEDLYRLSMADLQEPWAVSTDTKLRLLDSGLLVIEMHQLIVASKLFNRATPIRSLPHPREGFNLVKSRIGWDTGVLCYQWGTTIVKGPDDIVTRYIDLATSVMKEIEGFATYLMTPLVRFQQIGTDDKDCDIEFTYELTTASDDPNGYWACCSDPMLVIKSSSLNLRVIRHELLHAIGLAHMHQHWLFTKLYATLDDSQLTDPEQWTPFSKPTSEVADLQLGYEPTSIMHYDVRRFYGVTLTREGEKIKQYGGEVFTDDDKERVRRLMRPWIFGFKYNGDFCDYSYECSSRFCHKGRCQTNTCSSNADCVSGFEHCYGGTCCFDPCKLERKTCGVKGVWTWTCESCESCDHDNPTNKCKQDGNSRSISCLSGEDPPRAYRAITIKANPGLCVDVEPGGNNNVHIIRCHGHINQKFRMDKQGFIHSQYENHKCLEYDRDDSGRNVRYARCIGTLNQRWVFDKKTDQLKTQEGHDLCLDFAPSGANLYMGPCHSNWNQKFVWTPSPMLGRSPHLANHVWLVSRQYGTCVDAQRHHTADEIHGYHNLYLNPCHKNANQKFLFAATQQVDVYSIRTQDTNLCMDWNFGNPNANIYESKCHDGRNQQWKIEWVDTKYFVLRSVHDSNRCADVLGSRNTHGNAGNIYSYRCTGGMNQQWKAAAVLPRPRPTPKPTPAPTKASAEVYLKNPFHQKYVRARSDAHDVDIAPAPFGQEKWFMEKQPDGRYTFRSYRGTYLRGFDASNGWAVDTAPAALGLEQWSVHSEGGRYCLRSHGGRFLRFYSEANDIIQATACLGDETIVFVSTATRREISPP